MNIRINLLFPNFIERNMLYFLLFDNFFIESTKKNNTISLLDFFYLR